MKLPLVYYGNPILRKKAEPVTQFDEELFELIKNMKETVLSLRGFGLSAPQVGISKAIFITSISVDEQDIAPIEKHTVYINPRIDSVSDEAWFEEEGCLSIPKIYLPIERPLHITITAQDEHGQWRTETVHDWKAKVILHENDHLNGVLFVDRATRKDRKRIEKNLKMIEKQYNK